MPLQALCPVLPSFFFLLQGQPPTKGGSFNPYRTPKIHGKKKGQTLKRTQGNPRRGKTTRQSEKKGTEPLKSLEKKGQTLKEKNKKINKILARGRKKTQGNQKKNKRKGRTGWATIAPLRAEPATDADSKKLSQSSCPWSRQRPCCSLQPGSSKCRFVLLLKGQFRDRCI